MKKTEELAHRQAEEEEKIAQNDKRAAKVLEKKAEEVSIASVKRRTEEKYAVNIEGEGAKS